MVAENIFFGIIAAAMVIGALGVVTTKNIVHAALYLVIVLAGGAAQFLRNPDYLVVAGKIVSVEARHASAIRDVLGRSFAGQLGSVVAALGVGTVVYLIACRALKGRELGALLALLRRFKARLT